MSPAGNLRHRCRDVSATALRALHSHHITHVSTTHPTLSSLNVQPSTPEHIIQLQQLPNLCDVDLSASTPYARLQGNISSILQSAFLHNTMASLEALANVESHIANADRSSGWSLGVTYCRQCHDMVGPFTSRASPWPDIHSSRNAVIIGPADTPFEDGTFRLVMHFEEQYPNKPPGVKFISQMFHPNVYATGELCLDILQNRWSPTYDVAAILTSIQR